MIRLTLHRVNDNTFRARSKDKTEVKNIYIRDFNYSDELYTYTLRLRLREFMRDLLYKEYGNSWREVEARNINSINKSIRSCIKRMR